MNTNLPVVNIASATAEPSLGEWHERLNEARRSTVNSVLNLAGEYHAFWRSCARTQGGSLYTSKMQEWYGIGKNSASMWATLGAFKEKLSHHDGNLPESMLTLHPIRDLPDEIIATKVTPSTTQREAKALRAQFKPPAPESTPDEPRRKDGRPSELVEGMSRPSHKEIARNLGLDIAKVSQLQRREMPTATVSEARSWFEQNGLNASSPHHRRKGAAKGSNKLFVQST